MEGNEQEKEDIGKIKISCDRFGSSRSAACCVHYDRYRGCRRNCLSLKKLLIEDPQFAKKTERYFALRAVRDGRILETLFGKNEFAGKNLPDPVLGCRFCNFIAKSERGLKIHMKRTHRRCNETGKIKNKEV